MTLGKKERLIKKALKGNKKAVEILSNENILIPCPFCGGDSIYYIPKTEHTYEVVCSKCNTIKRNTNYSNNPINDLGQILHDVILEWNTRAKF